MPALIVSPSYLLETCSAAGTGKGQMLTIARVSDGHCVALFGKSMAGDVRRSISTHGPERTLATYLRAAAKEPWQPLYKPAALARMIAGYLGDLDPPREPRLAGDP